MKRALLSLIAFAASAQTLPPGKGQKLLLRECGACHPVEITTGAKYARDRWQAVVEEMRAKGARLSKSELSALVDYLAKNFKP